MSTYPSATPVSRSFLSRTRVLFLIALVAAIVIPLFSSSSAHVLSRAGLTKSAPQGFGHREGPGSTFTALNSAVAPWSPSGLGVFLPVPQSSPEEIATFAADCTTPRTMFILGETVCAKTVFVSETDRFVNWFGPNGHEFGGPTQTPITTNQAQDFLYTPTIVGSWKASIADPNDSSIVEAPFEVVPPPPMATYDSTCTIPKTTFELGETVCARATGLAGFRFAWVDAAGYIEKRTPITSDPQEDTFVLPMTQTSMLDGVTVDNRGEWRVNAITNRGSVRTGTFFTVKDPDNPVVDLSITKSLLGDYPQENGIVQFEVIVMNNGPDDAANTRFQDNTFSGATYNSVTQTEGLPFICSGSGSADCSIALFPKGSKAKFLVNFTAGPAGGDLQNAASVSSDTTEQNSLDNTFTTGSVKVGSGTTPPVCTLNCPNNINAIANTEENNQRGAHVSYAATVVSDEATCGTVTTTPASGSFFPVGTTTVTSTSELNGGSCSFTITVEDQGTNPPTITCPANPPAANANSDCEAVVTITNPTVTGNNVTFSGTRSDGKPMYNCDCFPNSPNQQDDACNIHGACSRRADAPFQSGTTTITWIAYSHDIAGPYATPEIEEAHRTGAASCTVTVVVDDTTPPVITAQSSTVSADANCQAVVPDYSNTVSDNCACSSSDESENCQGHPHFTVTQSPAPGTIVGPGSHTIHIEANDGSSNNNGAGNTSTKDITLTVNDTTAPTITCPANVTTNTAPGTCSASVNPGTATATDNCDITPTITGTRSDGRPLTDTYPGGTTTITWTATDDAGNHSECAQTVTVHDNENPTISCPANITTGTDPNSCSATVNPGSPTASDNCGSPTVTGVRSDGQALNAPYPKGTTTITWTATDSSGNQASCNQTITVNDTQPPVITCQADIIADFNPAVNGAVVSYTTPVGTDNCPGATTAQTAGLASGSTFPLGTTTVTFRVTDAAGLTATCSFKVTVALTSIIGLDSVTMTGAGYADSYSSAGGYPATKGSLANILSNGTITMGNSAKVWGNVRSTRANVNMTGASQVTGNATAGTNVTTSGSATVGGTRTNNALAPVMTLPSVPACSPFSSASGITGTYSYNASTGNLTLSGVNIATLANGNYCFNNVTLGNSAQLKVNGPVVIKLKGTLNTSGATNLNNTTQIPSNLRILSSYSGSNGVVIGNSASIYALIYAPKTSVNLSGAAPLFGTAAGKTLTIGNSGAIHYDTQLKSVWPDIWTLIFGP